MIPNYQNLSKILISAQYGNLSFTKKKQLKLKLLGTYLVEVGGKLKKDECWGKDLAKQPKMLPNVTFLLRKLILKRTF